MDGKHVMRMELVQSIYDGANDGNFFVNIIFCIKDILPCVATYRRKDDEGICESNKSNSR